MTDKNEDVINSHSKEEIKKMLSKVESSNSSERNIGNIRVVSLKRNYEQTYKDSNEDNVKMNNEDNKKEFITVRPPLKQPMLSSNRNEDFEKRNIPLSELQDKIKTSINESLKYYQNKSKIVFASESKNNSIQNNIYQTNPRQQMQNNINNQLQYDSNHHTNPFLANNNQNKSKRIVAIIKPSSSSNDFSSYSSNRSLVTQAMFTLVGSGVVLVVFLYSMNEEERQRTLDSILSINPYRVLFCAIIIAGAIIICILLNEFQEKKRYYEIAAEDLNDLENQINKGKNDNNFIGVFQSQFIKERAESRMISEGKYIKKVLPLLTSAINNKKVIKETTVLISSQEHKMYINNDNSMEII